MHRCNKKDFDTFVSLISPLMSVAEVKRAKSSNKPRFSYMREKNLPLHYRSSNFLPHKNLCFNMFQCLKITLLTIREFMGFFHTPRHSVINFICKINRTCTDWMYIAYYSELEAWNFTLFCVTFCAELLPAVLSQFLKKRIKKETPAKKSYDFPLELALSCNYRRGGLFTWRA